MSPGRDPPPHLFIPRRSFSDVGRGGCRPTMFWGARSKCSRCTIVYNCHVAVPEGEGESHQLACPSSGRHRAGLLLSHGTSTWSLAASRGVTADFAKGNCQGNGTPGRVLGSTWSGRRLQGTSRPSHLPSGTLYRNAGQPPSSPARRPLRSPGRWLGGEVRPAPSTPTPPAVQLWRGRASGSWHGIQNQGGGPVLAVIR